MAEKMIFLSHIHEEKELAILLQEAIENEFSGFVTVFVSSDGSSIPIGSNFLNAIRKGLTKSIAAIYLISPKSVKRPWISFELGAVWSRSAISEDSGNGEIPAMPFCHSGIHPSALPQPMCNLNSIEANKSNQLEVAFKSIQRAVGGKGILRTNFDNLALKISDFEHQYMLADNIKKIFEILKLSAQDKDSLEKAISNLKENYFVITMSSVPENLLKELESILKSIPAGNVSIQSKYTGLMIGSSTGYQSHAIELKIKLSLLKEYLTSKRN